MISKPLFLLSAALLLFGTQAHTQQTGGRFRSAALFTGIGFELNQPDRYSPVYLAADLSWQFGRTPRKDFLAFYLEPQFNPVLTTRPLDIEFGCNIGLRYYQRLTPRLLLYEMIGSGPHYITAELPSQANGFIFSDNAAIGIYVQPKPDKPFFWNFQVRFRHLSNASLKRPNSGVDNINLILGLGKIR